MSVAVFAVFVCIWTIPLFIKRKKQGLLGRKDIINALLLGLFPVTIILLLSETVVVGNIFKLTGVMDWKYYGIVQAFITYALVEEICKFFGGKFALRKAGKVKKIDVVMIFGCIGIGYEIIESLMKLLIDKNVVSGIIRGAFAAHVMFQFFMGAHFFEAKLAKQKGDDKKYRREMIIAIVVTFLIHGIGDATVAVSNLIAVGEDAAMTNGILTIILTIINLFTLILGLYSAYKSLKCEEVLELKPVTEPAVDEEEK